MYLHNDLDDGSRIVSLDLGSQSLQMLSKASLNAIKTDYLKFSCLYFQHLAISA